MHPSYVSLASALSYYQFIPEGVFSTEAVTTVKTVAYDTTQGRFNYHRLKPGYFFGYTIARFDQYPVLIAEPEKAILDFLYLNSRLHHLEDFAALRINTDAIKATINWRKLLLYGKVFDSHTLTKRIRLFQKNLLHVTT